MPSRPNYRGRPVAFPLGALLLPAGVALALIWPWPAGSVPWLVFLAGVGALGLIDDCLRRLAARLAGPRPGPCLRRALHRRAQGAGHGDARGLGGRGPRSRVAPSYVAAVGVLALAAHLGNLLDTRPGRTEKALALALALLCLGS